MAFYQNLTYLQKKLGLKKDLMQNNSLTCNPLPPWRWRGVSFFRASGGSASSYGQWADSFRWGESQLGILLGGIQYQFLAQLASTGSKSVEVNLTNCDIKICRSKFYQILTSDILTFYPLSTLLEPQVFSEMLNPHQYNDFIDLVKISFVVQMLYNTVL